MSSDTNQGDYYNSAFESFVDNYIKDDEGLRNTHFDFYLSGESSTNQRLVDYVVSGENRGYGYNVTIVIYPRTTITESNLYMRIYAGVPDPNSN